MPVAITPGQFRDLPERIRQGDASAETELVHQFTRRIFVMGVVRTHDREAARDLVQDVLIAVIGSLRKGQLLDPDKLAAFVHGTARNLINNRLRTERQQPQLEPLSENLAQACLSEELEYAERTRLVLQGMNRLGDEDRQILWMTLVEGRGPAEIASSLGLSSEVVRTRKGRAIRKVTDLIRNKLSRTLANCHIVKREL